MVDEIARAARNETHRQLTEGELRQIKKAAADLEGIWEAMRLSEVPGREDALSALTSAMIAYRLLEEKAKALAMAGEVLDRTDFEPALMVAVQVALAFDDDATAQKGLARLPETGDAGFMKAMAVMNNGEPGRAAEIFKKATVPRHERVFVDAMIALAPIQNAPLPGDDEILEQVRSTSTSEPRAQILVARMAKQRNLVDM